MSLMANRAFCAFIQQKHAYLKLLTTGTMEGIGKPVGPAFTELQNAFNAVDHDILYKTLEHYSVQQCELF